MTQLPPDPLEPGGIAEYGKRLRAGTFTAEAATEAYLGRIETLDGHLGAYQHVAGDRARVAARAIDGLLAAGTDLGPLMGVPVALKDLFAVDGMPTTAGSRLDVGDLIGLPGTFVRRILQAGCIILGKTKTPEFAFGRGGINPHLGTPRSPWDAKTHRLPGGSSSGSGVAMAAGLCGFAVGTDTGGSVRVPAALNGVFGLKTTAGTWPADGLFPLSPTLDSIGLLTRSASDAAIAFAALTGRPAARSHSPRGLRLGRPNCHFFDDPDPEVATSMEAALGAIEAAGVEIVPMELSEAGEIRAIHGELVPAELIASLGRERFEIGRASMDPANVDRVSAGLEVTAERYIRLKWHHAALRESARRCMDGLDGWISPTTGVVAPPLAVMDDPQGSRRYSLMMTRNTQPGAWYGFCATSTPIHGLGSPLPVGLQIHCRGGEETTALSIALMLDELLGPQPRPDLARFA